MELAAFAIPSSLPLILRTPIRANWYAQTLILNITIGFER